MTSTLNTRSGIDLGSIWTRSGLDLVLNKGSSGNKTAKTLLIHGVEGERSSTSKVSKGKRVWNVSSFVCSGFLTASGTDRLSIASRSCFHCQKRPWAQGGGGGGSLDRRAWEWLPEVERRHYGARISIDSRSDVRLFQTSRVSQNRNID